MTTRRAKKPAPAISNRFDGEVLGLVLFALGIFLGITVALPSAGSGFMATAHDALTGWLGWGEWVAVLPSHWQRVAGPGAAARHHHGPDTSPKGPGGRTWSSPGGMPPSGG